MKTFFKVGKRLTKSQQKNIYGGQNDVKEGPFCVGAEGSWACPPTAPHWIDATNQCCDSLPSD